MFDPDIKVLHFTEIRRQPHLPLAMARLAKEGRRHWYSKQPSRITVVMRLTCLMTY